MAVAGTPQTRGLPGYLAPIANDDDDDDDDDGDDDDDDLSFSNVILKRISEGISKMSKRISKGLDFHRYLERYL